MPDETLSVAIEPVSRWRLLAKRLDAALSVREHPSAGRDAHAPGVGVLWRSGMDTNDCPEIPGIQKFGSVVASSPGIIVTEQWLRAATLVLTLWHDPEAAADDLAFETVLVPRDPSSDPGRWLFPVLAQQLAGSISHPKRAFICERCDTVFYPEGWAPQQRRKDRRLLCRRCGPLAKAEKQREAKRNKREERSGREETRVSNRVSNES